ncbi:hypothetical protein GCM10027432_21600 [Lysobacter fragariae]
MDEFAVDIAKAHQCGIDTVRAGAGDQAEEQLRFIGHAPIVVSASIALPDKARPKLAQQVRPSKADQQKSAPARPTRLCLGCRQTRRVYQPFLPDLPEASATCFFGSGDTSA